MRTTLGGVLGKIPIPYPATMLVVALLALFVAASGTAVAAVNYYTSLDGTITACRDNKTGLLRVIDIGQSCTTSKETTVTWKDGITGKVADSDKLDGKDSTYFYAAGSKVSDAAHADSADHATSADSATNADSAGDANTLDGKNSTDFVSGTGSMTIVDEQFSDPDGYGDGKGFSRVISVPGAQIQATCVDQVGGTQVSVTRTNGVVNLWRDDGGADPLATKLYSSPSDPTTDTDSLPLSMADRVIWQGSSSAGTFTAVLFTEYERGGGPCDLSGYVVSAQKAAAAPGPGWDLQTNNP